MKLGLKLLVSLEIAVCLSSSSLTAMEGEGSQHLVPATRVKRLYRAPLHAGPIPLPEGVAPQQPVMQNYTESPFSPRPNSGDEGALPPPQGDETKAQASPKPGIRCVIL